MPMMFELPTAAQAYRILLQEETHLALRHEITCPVKWKRGSIKKESTTRTYQDSYKASKQNRLFIHCKISGHTCERCWKIVGYPI